MGEFDPGPDTLAPHSSIDEPDDPQPPVATKSIEQPTSSPVIPIAQSRPVEENGATANPTSQPVTSQPGKPVEEPFQMEGAHFSGSIKFDVTNGRLVELTLRSNSAFFKVMRSDKEEMKIKQGSKHILRIKGSVTPPPRPNIPGGKKPPVEKVLPNARPTVQPVGAATRPAQPGTTQPAGSGLSRPIASATTRPAPALGASSQPAISARQPAVLNKSIVPAAPSITSPPKQATTQPIE